MASSEVDQKYLGHFAKTTAAANPYLSCFLFRVLGLSVILAEKLLRARKTKRFDPLRDPNSKQLVHHILWLAREGLVMVEQYVLPMVGNYVELKVLSYKLRASFYHIFVLFHNEPPVSRKATSSNTASYSLFPDPLSPRAAKNNTPPRQRTPSRSGSVTIGGPVGGSTTVRTPPGLPLPQIPNQTTHRNSATFLLPLLDYRPTASSSFLTANTLAESLLPGSHPVRLSVKVEYVAYLYDCLREAEQSRRLARKSIKDVYEAQEGMDDEDFEDAAEMVGILGRMMKRGLGGGSSGSASVGRSTPGRTPGNGNGNGNGNGRVAGPQLPQQSQQSPSPGGRGGNARATGQQQREQQQSPGRTSGNGGGRGTSARGQVTTAPSTWV